MILNEGLSYHMSVYKGWKVVEETSEAGKVGETDAGSEACEGSSTVTRASGSDGLRNSSARLSDWKTWRNSKLNIFH